MTAIAPKNNNNQRNHHHLEVVNLTDDDDDVSVLYSSTAGKMGTESSNPISVENYNSRPKRVIDFSDYTFDDDFDDDVQVLNWSPPARKIFKGESSNSKIKSVNDDGIGGGDLTFMCGICVDEKPKTDSFRILGCNHSYCSECMATYVALKLQENVTSITCPVSGCGGRLEPEYCRSILPPQVFDRWGDVLCESLILGSQKFYCPFKDCSALLIDERGGGSNNEVIMQSECPNCYRLFCAQCSVAWHPDISCDEFKKLNKNEREREDILLMNLAKKKKWMRCPKCKFYVERSQGCLFMTCRCKYTFCYNCGAEMRGNHYCKNCKH